MVRINHPWACIGTMPDVTITWEWYWDDDSWNKWGNEEIDISPI